VQDEGPGYSFDIQAQEVLAGQMLVEQHRGLVMIRNLAARLEITANGSCILMEFPYPPSFKSV
jgi:hypothetical protein